MNENDFEQLSVDLRALADKRAELDIQSETMPERMQAVIETAKKNLDTKIEAILRDAVFIEAIETLESQLAQDTAQIEQLSSDGLLSEEEQLSLITELVSGPSYDLLRLTQSLKGGVALNESVEVVLVNEDESRQVITEDTEVAVDTATEETSLSGIETEEQSDIIPDIIDNSEVDIEKIITLLTVIDHPDGKELKVGRTRGIRYKFSKSNDTQKDYTQERLKVLELLVSAGDAQLNVQYIQEALNEAGLDSSRNSLRLVRDWLKSITFKGNSLFETNDKRGLASAYWINPALDVTLQYQNVETSINRAKSLGASRSQSNNNKPEAQPTPSVLDSVSQSTIPLRESAVLLTFLKDNSDLLECLGIPIPDREMVDIIDLASNEEDIKNGINRTSLTPEKLEQERYDVARQFRVVFSEENLFDAFIDLISNDSVLNPVVDYLSDIEDAQWDLLLQQVLKYRTSTTTIESSSGHAGTNPDKLITFIHLPNGTLFKRTTSLIDNKTKFEIVKTKPRWKEDDTVNIQSASIKPEAETPEAVNIITEIIQDTGTATVAESAVQTPIPPKSQESKKEAPWETELKKAVGETLTQFEEIGLIFEGGLDAKRIGKIANSTKMATKEAITRLIANGRSPVAKNGSNPHDWTFDLPSVVTMNIQNSMSNIFDSKTRRREAHKIIDACVASFMTEWKKRQS